jgi:uncharacterized protein with HEPN domain
MPLEPRDIGRLKDMVVYARDAIHLLAGRSLQQMTEDLATRLALIRCVEVIGEAGHQVSPNVQAALPTIPWHAMWGMRNRLVHDYGNTNYKILHGVVSANLPGLATTIEAFLAAQAPAPDSSANGPGASP